MASQYWDAGQAHAYHEFQYHFPEKTIAGKTIIVAGGSGGLGAATVALLVREGAHLVVGYRSNRERGEGGSVVLLETMQALGVFAPSLNYTAPKAALVHAACILAQQWNIAASRCGAIARGCAAAVVAEKGKCQNTRAC